MNLVYGLQSLHIILSMYIPDVSIIAGMDESGLRATIATYIYNVHTWFLYNLCTFLGHILRSRQG